MAEKNAQDRFNPLADKQVGSVDKMTEEELRRFPEEWLARYRQNKRKQGEISDETENDPQKEKMPSGESAS